MTGMWNFKFSLCCLSLATLTSAAEISFSDDNKITGEVIAMDEKGTVTLNAPYSSQPLSVNAEKITKIDFGKSEQNTELPHQNITLINGDSFPVGIRSLDDKVLRINSPVLGDLDVPREFIDSLEVGIFSKKTIYTGPNKISEWKNAVDEISDWKLDDGRLTASGNSLIYRNMELPENYSVRFKLEWDSNPNFRFYFGDPMDYTSGKISDRYYLEFARGGLRIMRDSTGKTRNPTIALINRSQEEFKGNQMWIEVRVNRKGGRLDLYINDQLEGRYVDTYPNIPSGKGIAFYARSMADSQISLSKIEVCEWEDRGERHRSEDRGNDKEDAIIGRNGERFGGRLISIADGEDGKIYRFKSDFQLEPIIVPDSEVSSIFFAVQKDKKPNKTEDISLYFQGQGSFQVTKCIFNANTLNVTHPLLGDLEISRQAITRLERLSASTSNQTTAK